MDINTNTLNTFGYKGIARITIKNKKRRHSFLLTNEGTLALGSVIVDALANRFNSRRIPQWIGFDIQRDTEYQTILNRQIPLTGIVTGDSVNDPELPQENVIGKIQFTAVIISSDLIKIPYSGNNYRLKITNSSGEDLAYIYDIRPSGQNQLQLLYNALNSGQDALIDWVMYFSNAASTEGN